MSAEEKELERIKVEYDLLDGGTIVDIQVVSSYLSQLIYSSSSSFFFFFFCS